MVTICCPIGGYFTLRAHFFLCSFMRNAHTFADGQAKTAGMKNSFQFDIVHCNGKMTDSIITKTSAR